MRAKEEKKEKLGPVCIVARKTITLVLMNCELVPKLQVFGLNIVTPHPSLPFICTSTRVSVYTLDSTNPYRFTLMSVCLLLLVGYSHSSLCMLLAPSHVLT